MRILLVIAAVAALVTPLHAGECPDFERFFTSGCMRVDMFHSGTAAAESFSIDEVVREPYWGGNPRSLADTLGLGAYLLRVFDLETNALIFSRGYCTVFGEWKTTDEAAGGVIRTFHESVRLPYPKATVQIRIDGRDRGNVFRNLFDVVVDPSDYHINNESRYRGFKKSRLVHNGSPERKVDIVIMGDGYKRDEIHKLRKDAERMLEVLFGVEPFAGRKRDFNVHLIETVSEDSGIDEPRKGFYRSTPLGLSFNSLDLSRYVLALPNKEIRSYAAAVPYDQIMIIANTERYGGGGIFNLYSTCTSDNEYSGYVFVHELGHAFAGLGDEYYSSTVVYNDAYPEGVEPWEPNITALLDTTDIKWGDMIGEGTPVPTPDDSTYAGTVGCFEGAGYSAEGLYRPCRDCWMFSKKESEFCPVCRRAIDRMIDFHTE